MEDHFKNARNALAFSNQVTPPPIDSFFMKIYAWKCPAQASSSCATLCYYQKNSLCWRSPLKSVFAVEIFPTIRHQDLRVELTFVLI